jgi:hypothetical protein
LIVSGRLQELDQLQEDDLSLRRAEGIGIDVTKEQAQLPCEMLPKHNVIFFGRVDIMELIAAKVRECEEQGKLGAVTLYGLGGIGKTQIALEFAHRREADHKAMFWVNSQTRVALDQDFSQNCTSFKTPWRESSQ